jgi:glycerophosphoryl diester phosphodiesterase
LAHAYLNSPSNFKVFAHRGFVFANGIAVRDENTISAFAAALENGADYLELDVQSSSDGIAVVFHDNILARVSRHTGKISSHRWNSLRSLELNHGSRIPSLTEVLSAFPDARINIDIKSEQAISNLVATIRDSNAESRVLITSFSEKRRKMALRLLPSAATSPSARLVLQIKIAHSLGFGLNRLLSRVNLLQIPVSYGFIRFDSPKFIEAIKRRGVPVVFWTINEPAAALALRDKGASGIVTDRLDLMVTALAE